MFIVLQAGGTYIEPNHADRAKTARFLNQPATEIRWVLRSRPQRYVAVRAALLQHPGTY